MYRFILTDLNFSPIGEVLRFTGDRTINFGTIRQPVPQVQFQVRMDNPMSEALALTECYLKVYKDDDLKVFGPVVAAEEVGARNGASLAVTAAGQAWVFQHRLAGKSPGGQAYTTLTDRAEIGRQLILTSNTDAPLHIDTDTASFSGSTATYLAGPYKQLSVCLAELSNLLDGFDWRVDPREVDGSGNIGTWTARPTLGVARPNVIFEYGVGRHNIADYKMQIARESQANQVFNPGTTAHKVATDAPSRAKWGLMEASADLQLNDEAMRQKLVDEHIRVRKNPRRVITFTPHIATKNTGRVPVYGVDYELGDIVVARAVLGRSVRFNGDFRVYGVQVSIDKNGIEQVTLTLTDDG